ncbi:DNA mismatch repair protein MutT [Xenorhabdus mauleonii]|uniref:DNA mismatch repair protein MutT n=1 Tax=Xenorhabdus mauleonii TaxID=351675 RepID=A0A1I3M5C8_9GAMM|nr:NUDIX domain-containing protein [Xenorhabdus mauleonii]PHM45404.1 DNA mismatch repair protein MutT [Xenorhabdus mauleonii]SFI92172.1 NUDIX domain-containing protein [Xenorhabdus mauleonii]
MRVRCSARLLIINSSRQVLLFRFAHTNDALAGKSYWATPGGGVEHGESFEQAAVRELKEETGIIRDNVGKHVAQRAFEMTLPSGETVLAKERFFIVLSDEEEINNNGWTDNEKSVIHRHHWWGLKELIQTQEIIYPSDITKIISSHLFDNLEPMNINELPITKF